ncbi:MAG: hypothetical protein GY703_07525 [Gammaproteobacteria bacterium]|nr:hypothetical protein [Gammaproteobacteria bacterium]
MRSVLLILLFTIPLICGAEDRPQVLGFGVKSCRDYSETFREWKKGEGKYIEQYLRYRSWFAGLVTGLSLATGVDVIKGVELNGAMRRVEVYCGEHPEEDFFNASMRLIRALSGLS